MNLRESLEHIIFMVGLLLLALTAKLGAVVPVILLLASVGAIALGTYSFMRAARGEASPLIGLLGALLAGGGVIGLLMSIGLLEMGLGI